MRYPIKKIGFTDFAVRGNYVWFCDMYHSRLIKMDISTGEMCLEAVMPAFPVGRQMGYGTIIIHEDKLVITPRNADRILIYDLKSRDMTELPLTDGEKPEGKPLFINAFAYKNNIFLVPGRFFALVKLNMDNMELTYYDKIVEDAKAYQSNCTDIMVNCRPVVIDCYCILPIFGTNVFVQMDLDTGNYVIKKSEKTKMRILATACDENDIWFAGFDEGLFRYNFENERFEEFEDFSGISKPKIGIGQILNYKNQIIIFPINESRMIVFDKHTKKYHRLFEIPVSPNTVKHEEWAITGCDLLGAEYIKEGIVLMFSAFTGQLLSVNIEEATWKVYDGMLTGDRDEEDLLRQYIKNGEVIYEEDWGLSAFIKSI